MFCIIISLLCISISYYRKEKFKRSVRAPFHTDFLILIRNGLRRSIRITRIGAGGKREGARGYPTIYACVKLHGTHARGDVRSRSRYVTAFRREGESWARTILGPRSRAHTARRLLMSASQSGNFSTSHRVMHEPRGGEQAILPDQSKWARHGNCRTLGGASIWKPFPSNGRSSALKNLDRDPHPLGINDIPEGYGIWQGKKRREIPEEILLDIV